MKYFNIVLLIRHPDIDPNLITDELGLKPHISQKAGDDVSTPNGKQVGGKYRDSRWNHVWKFSGDEKIYEELPKIINAIYPYNKFLMDIIDGGGEVSLIFNLPGGVNHGFEIDNGLLQKVAALGIKIGFEVFPDWKNNA